MDAGVDRMLVMAWGVRKHAYESAFFGILIRMYYDDHNPPHFHAYYGEHEAIIAIQTLEVMEGNLPKRALAMVLVDG